MSRGLGKWQRAILEAIANNDLLVRLGGKTRSEKVSLLRAAKKLEDAGKCVIVRLWNDAFTAVIPFVGRPDLTIDGKPAKELSVERVPCGTATAFKGSHRQIAEELGISKSQVARDSKGMGII